MTTTTLTLREERVMATKQPHRTVREVVGWNRRAAVYYTVVGIICLMLERIHP